MTVWLGSEAEGLKDHGWVFLFDRIKMDPGGGLSNDPRDLPDERKRRNRSARRKVKSARRRKAG
jgi:hypothetical protein